MQWLPNCIHILIVIYSLIDNLRLRCTLINIALYDVYLLLDLEYIIFSLNLACYSLKRTALYCFLLCWWFHLFKLVKFLLELWNLPLLIENIVIKRINLLVEDIKLRRSHFALLSDFAFLFGLGLNNFPS